VAAIVPVTVGVQLIFTFCAAPPSAIVKVIGVTLNLPPLAPLTLTFVTVKVALPVSLMVRVVLTAEPTVTLPTLMVLPTAGLEP